MRIPSGKIDQVIFFVAVDSTDLKTRKTGLSGFVVYRSRNGGTATIYTTPTITELSAANMPGVYSLLIDEDTTVASTSDSEEYVVHITAATMAPVTRSIELYRRDTTSGLTALIDASGRVDVGRITGQTQTARDIGASVLLSSGTGTGQLSLSAGLVALSGTQTFNNTGTWTGNIVGTLSTLTTYTGNTVQTGDAFARLGAPAGASVSADVAAVKADTGAIKTKTDFLPSATAGAAGGVFIAGVNAATTVNFTGNLSGSVGSVTGLTAANLDVAVSTRMATYTQPGGFLAATFPTGTIANTTNITAASGISLAASQHVIVDSGTVTTVTNQLTAAQIATGVWQDTTAGDFTTASSIGKSLYTSGAVPGAAGGHFIAGSNAATTVNFTGSLSGSVGSVTARVTANADQWNAVNVTGMPMPTYTQPGGFLAATFPTGTLANTTNITAGTITTTTNLTNAATAGDLTATMKTSIAGLTIARVTLVDTVTTYTGNTVQTGDAFARLGAPAGASVSADVAAVKADTGAIKTKTDFLPSATAGAAGGVFIAGVNAATTVNFTGNLSGSVGSVTGLTAANLDVAVSTRMASYTQPTGFLAATFPSGTLANTTNITAGTITTTTNLTNAATAGDLTATMKTSIAGLTIARVTLTDTVTTYTGNTVQTGDSFARIGATGGGLTSLAPASTALSSATWTTARSGYLDNLNVGGVVASQADINALNQSASRRVLLAGVPQYERPESGSTTYTIEARTFDGDGAVVNADSTPTLTATGIVSGSLAANLSAATNPVTGVYRWTYTVASSATVEQIRFDLSATIAGATFTISHFSQVVDEVGAKWNTTDASNLTAIFNALPANFATLTITGGAVTVGVNNDKTGYALAANQHVIVDSGTVTTLTNLPAAPTDWLTAAGVSAGAVTKIQTGLSTYAGGDTAGTTTLLSRIVGTLASGTHTPQTGDSYARIGAAGAGLTALGDTRLAHLNVDIDSRMATFTYTAPNNAGIAALPTAAQNADAMLLRNIESGGTGGRTVAQALAFLRNKWTASGSTLTVFAADDTTPLWTATLAGDAGAIPITGSDPA